MPKNDNISLKIKRQKELHDQKILFNKHLSQEKKTRRETNMRKLVFAIIALIFLNGLIFSQSEKYSTPTVWEDYFVKDENVTVQMPKLPVFFNGGDACRGEKTLIFAAYSDDVVYFLLITSKTKSPEYCRNRKKFDEKSFNERIQNLKNANKSSKIIENANEVKFVDEKGIYKLINDYENKRWFELQVFGANESKAEVKKFLDSLKIGENSVGKEIGKGATRNYGDQNVSDDETLMPKNKSPIPKTFDNNVENINFILKPKAVYTDAARQNQIQGTVRVKVTFLANGGIGSIDPTSNLPFGLTEQAISAASKIFFIPAKKQGKPINVVKIVEYNFAIY